MNKTIKPWLPWDTARCDGRILDDDDQWRECDMKHVCVRYLSVVEGNCYVYLMAKTDDLGECPHLILDKD